MIVVFQFFTGYAFYKNKLKFGTFTGRVSEPLLDFTFYFPNGEVFNAKDCRNKIVILDFWNSGCGICFEKFLILQQLYQLYKRSKKVLVYAVNVPLRRDSAGLANHVVKTRHLTVPLLMDKDGNGLKRFGVYGVPVVVVIKDGKRIIYRGDIEGVTKVIDN